MSLWMWRHDTLCGETHAGLGDVHPLCLGAYDPDARMHEPGESLSMPDLIGCTRSIMHFLCRVDEVYDKSSS